MDVVADSGSIFRGVIVAVDAQGAAKSCRALGDEGYQVLGNAQGELAYSGRGMRPNGIEIAQRASFSSPSPQPFRE